MAKLQDVVVDCVVVLLNFFVAPWVKLALRWYHGVKGQHVPRVRSSLLLTPASDLASRIREGEVRSEDVVAAAISRIEDVNPLINAVVANRFKEALEDARRVDEVVRDGQADELYPRKSCPFLGVPFTAKEAVQIKDLPNCTGLRALATKRCGKNAPVVDRLIAAGAIPLGVTNVSELCMWSESSNKVYGITRNAYDTSRHVGGSSGGEACLISAAGSLFGIGSDIGGSIRMPAFFNGIWGHKPTRHVVPNDGQFPNAVGEKQDFLVTGPLCRYVADLRPALAVMAGPEMTNKLKLQKKTDVRGVKVYYMLEAGRGFVSAADPDIQACIIKAVNYLSGEGAEVEEKQLQLLRYGFDIWSTRMDQSGGPKFGAMMAEGQEKDSVSGLAELAKWCLGRSTHTLPAVVLALAENLTALTPRKTTERVVELGRALEAQLEELLAGAVLLFPTHPKPAQYHSEPLLLNPFNFAYTGVFNITGSPVTSVPMGLHSSGLPIGLQVVSARGNDALCLSVAEALSRGPAGWVPPYH